MDRIIPIPSTNVFCRRSVPTYKRSDCDSLEHFHSLDDEGRQTDLELDSNRD